MDKLLFKRYAVFMSKHSKINLNPTKGSHADYVIELDDTEIYVPKQKLLELYNALKGVVDDASKKQ